MTTSATLLSLADRVEAGSGVDRALDAEIACAVVHRNLRPAAPDDFDGKFGYSPGDMKVDTGFLMSRPYTGSLDAAMTLVPEGCGWLVGWGQTRVDEPMGGARITRNARFIGTRANYDVISEGEGDTPARALVAACLRAGAMEADNA